ncbi:hypothetical protein [Allomesorhizobium alhagi]|jgi:hypothetical protein|uniref:Uncharacterized protein n=1 Tax=Mesorhizobium alhagi CCNWXJ12-2 TaxID=1107882 RepID=H0HWH7_9HYPH|nr:hypothetical protein [Mesorhizobium alhagi]EHK55020.1 hypothetical protein MAXJ12_22686 [Mesorhizobium alhagi CCNWXJ12-2]
MLATTIQTRNKMQMNGESKGQVYLSSEVQQNSVYEARWIIGPVFLLAFVLAVAGALA